MRLRALFTGRVQGVGFRYTAQHIARRHDVVGFVQNLPDGSVVIVVEGDHGLRDFLDEVKLTMGAKIQGFEVSQQDATGEFDAFGIRY